jgi:hypothetical protein
MEEESSCSLQGTFLKTPPARSSIASARTSSPASVDHRGLAMHFSPIEFLKNQPVLACYTDERTVQRIPFILAAFTLSLWPSLANRKSTTL